MATTAPTKGPAIGRHVRANLSTAELYEDAIRHGEGLVAAEGPLVVRTGKHTGRSPEDKFIVDEPSSHDKIWWGPVNRPISEAHYDRLRARLVAYAASKDLYSQDCFIGAAAGASSIAAGLHRDRLGEHLRAATCSAGRRSSSEPASRRTSRSSASRRSRPTRRPRARGPARRSSSTSSGWRSSSSAPSTPARSRRARSRS